MGRAEQQQAEATATAEERRRRQERAAAARLQARADGLEREVVELEGQLSALRGLEREHGERGLTIATRERRSGLREAAAVALLSDWHCEETIAGEKVSGLNEFNLDIARARVSRAFHGIAWLVTMLRDSFSIRDVVLGVLGDLISGYIHEELVEANGLSPIYAARYARELLRAGIHYLLDELDDITLSVVCVHGNHGRTTTRPRCSTGAENSFEHLIYLLLAEEFATDRRVRFVVTTGEFVYLPIYDLVTRWAHGDFARYDKGIGGPMVPVNRAVLRLNVGRRADITNMGHFHSYLSTPALVMNGSLCGYSPFAQKMTFAFEPPQQAFYLIDSRRRKCLDTPLWCDDSDSAAEASARRGGGR